MTEREQLANHILRCLSLQGVRGMRTMTGADTFTMLENGLSFRFKGNRRMNHAHITLNAGDLFDMKLGRVRSATYTVVAETNDLQADSLRDVFQRETGLETAVPRIMEQGAV